MKLEVLVPLVAAITCFEFSIVFAFLYRKVGHRSENAAFSLMAFFMTWMLLSTLVFQERTENHLSLEAGLRWYRLLFVSTDLAVAALIHLTASVTRHPVRCTVSYLYVVIGGCSLLCLHPSVLFLPPLTPLDKLDEAACGSRFVAYALLPLAGISFAAMMAIRARSAFVRSRQTAPKLPEQTRQTGEIMPAPLQAAIEPFSPLIRQLDWLLVGMGMMVVAGILEMLDLKWAPDIVNFTISPRAVACTLFCASTAWQLGKELLVSERKKADLHVLAQARLQSTYGAEHQLKNGLSAVKRPLETLVKRMQHSMDPGDQYRKVVSAMEELDELFETLDITINVARVEAGAPLKLEDTDSIDICRVVQALCRKREIWTSGEAGHRFQVCSELSTPLVWVHAKALNQVLINLVDNALKYSPSDSLITVRIWQEQNQWLRLSITDQGNGIPPEDQAILFSKPFYRGQAEQFRTPGTGIGLYYASWYLEAQRGRLWVESKGTGQGSTFHISLPYQPDEPDTSPAVQASP